MTDMPNGRVALVTGANRGIGAAIAKRLSAEGARVAITHTREESAGQAAELAAELGMAEGRAMVLRLDCADSQAVVAAVDTVAETFGRFDILVSNAAVGNLQLAEE
ncbi:MAG: SDR family NAD(P)-dependent oxidoreductase, partial [Azospirillaceae bacterium]